MSSVDTYNRIQNKGIIFSKYTEPLLRNAVKVNGYRIVVNVLREIWARKVYKKENTHLHQYYILKQSQQANLNMILIVLINNNSYNTKYFFFK